MFKLISTLLSYLLGQFMGAPQSSISYEQIMNASIEKIKNLLSAFILAIAGIALATTGFLAAYFNVLASYDQNGSWSFGAVAVGGLVLVLAGSIFIYFSTQASSRVKTSFQEKPEPSNSPSPLELALASLVADYVRERAVKREQQNNSPETAAPPQAE